MRALASYLTGLGLLASLMFVGGAWTSPVPTTHLETVDVHPDHVASVLAAIQSFDDQNPAPATAVKTLPVGCSIPNIESTCAPTVVAGGLPLSRATIPVPPHATTTTTDAVAPTSAPAQAAPTEAAPVQAAATAPAPVAPPPAAPLAPKNVESWRSLVAAYFAPTDVDKALRVISCESSGDPNAKNPTSSASGLFQHLGRYWPERTVKSGWVGAEIFDPTANIAVAAWLVYEGGGWSHWNPSRHCWG